LAFYGAAWFALLVLLVDGILGFQTLADRLGSYALTEVLLILLVILPTVAVYVSRLQEVNLHHSQ
jgi:uncharacterized membrane protein YhaH (DUF805 family)